MKYKDWKVPSGGPQDTHSLVREGCSRLLAAILQLRGIDTVEQMREFLNGGAELLSDPLQLTDMIEAVRRLTRAIKEREHVAVYGDYDVDGITASCLLSDYLRYRGLECEIHIPDRLTEGYGVNRAAIDELCDMGVTLIVTVDCGVTSIVETAYAASRGVDMIITDHHEFRDRLPDAVAVVNSKRPDNNEVFGNLSGVGVAFKLVCALDGNDTAMLARYGDLVAVGTVADVMPLLGENRYITRCGLATIANGEGRPGFQALLKEAGAAEKQVTASVVSYTLAPRINAAGRLGDANLAVELLTTDDANRAREIAGELCEKNRMRQSLEKDIWDDAVAMLGGNRPTTPIVLSGHNWHSGVIGIVASRLTDVYGVPAVMICLDGDTGKGSCRSLGSFNLYEALSECSDCLEAFGGHAMAAGITVRAEKVDALREKLAQLYENRPEESAPALEADLLIDDAALLTMECVDSLKALEPCGNANPKPLLYLENALLTNVSPIGGGKHLRITLSALGANFDCVFFSRTAEDLGAVRGQAVDVVFAPQINEFRGSKNVQLVITDLRAHIQAGTDRIKPHLN